VAFNADTISLVHTRLSGLSFSQREPETNASTCSPFSVREILSELAHSPGMKYRGANRLIKGMRERKTWTNSSSRQLRESSLELAETRTEDMIYLERRVKDLRAIPRRVSKNNGMLLQCKKRREEGEKGI